MLRVMLICLLPFAASAQEGRESFALDFEALFKDRADEVRDETVQDGPVTLVLELGPVTVTAVQNENATDYIAQDRSPEGAVGCLMRILASLRQVAPCEGVMDVAQAVAIEGAFDKVLTFYAANTWPPVPQADRARAVATIRADFDRAMAPDPEVCAAMTDPDRLAEARKMAGAIVGGIDKGAVEAMLAAPRLPVSDPCM